jgi:DNA-binding beta-propeller fold protein YncE
MPTFRRIVVVCAVGFAAVIPAAGAEEASPSAEGRTLVAGHKWDDSVCFYEAATGKRLASTKVGRRPHELAVSHDRRFAYATLYGIDLYTEDAEGGRAVAIVDLEKRAKIGEIDLGKYRRPHGIEVGHRSGRLFVTCDRPAALLILDPAERRVVQAIELNDPKSLPHMCMISADERTAFVACCGNAPVAMLDLSAGRDQKHISIGGVPMGMALSADGRTLFATNRTADGVAVIDAADGTVRRIIPIPGQPVRCVLTPDGRRLLTTLIAAGECAIVDVAKLEVTHRVPIGNRVEGLTVDPSGKFAYASAQADDKIVKFTLGDDPRPVLKIEAPGRPDPLAVLP